MKKIAWIFVIAVFLGSCDESPQDKKEPVLRKNSEENSLSLNPVEPQISDTTLVYELKDFTSEVRIKMPQNQFRGTVLVLQGWNFPNTSWSDSSNLEILASEMGYALVMPNMGKSIYHKRVYPQTRKDWRKYPTRTWLMDTMVAELQTKYALFLEEQSNFVMGLSTGGRGAFILAQEYPEIFKAGASLSGDYDQDAFPNDNLYRGYFGTNPEKWSADENPMSNAGSWGVSMYIAHGEADEIVPVKHALRLKEVKQQLKKSTDEWTFRIDGSAGHNYQFWGSEVLPILTFFSKYVHYN